MKINRKRKSVEVVESESVIMHRPAPGPDYWRWRCRICGKPVADHASIFQLLLNRK